MGRELTIQLAAAGCSVATCHHCDVSDEAQVLAFKDTALAAHGRSTVQVLVNNAVITGGGSFVRGPREDWDRVFGVNWFGVYHCSRAFVPLLVDSPAAALVNISSLNGFWASMG